jgi:adenosylhomocysteine nucleosidase
MPDCIVNVGVAGNLSKYNTFGDVVIATDLVQHDMDVVAFGIPLGQVPRMDVFAFQPSELFLKVANLIKIPDAKIILGRIVSGDQFICDVTKATFLADHFNAVACEMEGAAVAHVCHVNNVPFLIVRALSDMAGHEGDAVHSYTTLIDMAASRSSEVVRQLLNLV